MIGIDIVESNISIAQEHAHTDAALRHLLTYQCVSVEDLLANNADSAFDCVVGSEVIEHVANVDSFTCDLCRLVKVGRH